MFYINILHDIIRYEYIKIIIWLSLQFLQMSFVNAEKCILRITQFSQETPLTHQPNTEISHIQKKQHIEQMCVLV